MKRLAWWTLFLGWTAGLLAAGLRAGHVDQQDRCWWAPAETGRFILVLPYQLQTADFETPGPFEILRFVAHPLQENCKSLWARTGRF